MVEQIQKPTLVKRFADTPRGGDGFGSTGR